MGKGENKGGPEMPAWKTSKKNRLKRGKPRLQEKERKRKKGRFEYLRL